MVAVSADPVITVEHSYEWFKAFLDLIDTIHSGIITLIITWKSSRHRDPFSFGDCGPVHRVPQMLVFGSVHRDP